MQNTIKFIRYFLISLVASGFFIISILNIANASTVSPNGGYGTFASIGRTPVANASGDTALVTGSQPMFCGVGCATLDQSKYQDGYGYPNVSGFQDARGKVKDLATNKYLCLYAGPWYNNGDGNWYSNAYVSYISNSDSYICPKTDAAGRQFMNINGQNPWPVTEAWQPDVRFFGIDPRASWQVIGWDWNTWERLYGTGYSMYGDPSWETPISDYTKSVHRFDTTQYGGSSGIYGMAVNESGDAMYAYGGMVLLLKAGSSTPQVIWSGDFGPDYPHGDNIGNDYDSNAISVNSAGQFKLSLTKNYDGAEIILGTATHPEFRKISPELINTNIPGANATKLWNLSYDGRYALYGMNDYGLSGARIADLTTKTYIDVTSQITPGYWNFNTVGFGKDGSLWFIEKPNGPYGSQEWFVKRIPPNSNTAQTVTSVSCASQGCSYLYNAFTQFIKVFPDAGASGKVMYPKTISRDWGMDSDTKRTLAIKDASTGNEVTFPFDYDLMDGYFYFLGHYPKNIEGQKMIPFNIHPNWSDGYLGFIDIDNPAGANGIRFIKWYNHALDGTPLPYNEGQGIGPWYWHNKDYNFSLLSSTPNSISTFVPTNTLIALNFSRPVNKATVPGNIILERTGISSADMDVVASSGSTIVLRPLTILDKDTSYTVRLRTGLKDIDGEALGSETTFSFRTGLEPARPGQDGIISSTSLSPSCILGYSSFHPECGLLNQLVISANDHVVYGDPASTSTAGDPVSLPTGEFTYSNTLMHIPGDGPDYDFSLAYKSQAYSNGPVGISWDHSYNISLRENIDGSVTYFDGKFGVYTFTKDADGNFSRLPGIEADLVKTDTNYELRFTNGMIYAFNTDLRIASIRDKDNHALTFTYTGDKLTATTDTLGRTIIYDYYDHGRLKSTTDFSGRTVTLAYYSETDDGGSAYDLRSITINNGADPRTISFTYQKDATSEILSHNILTLTDSKGHEYVKNTYDADDRVVSQKYGDGTLTYAYETDPNNPKHITKTTATNKRGMKSEFIYDENGNTLSKNLFNGDVPVTTTYTYADNGKIATETKPLGNGVSYQYDAQNRLTEKREKADMTQVNNDMNDIVTKYEYATAFSIPTKITDPNGTIITTVLDAKGNITETKVLGVKKADGSTYDVASTFTYDTDGHLITKTDGVGNQTTYEYSNGRITKVIEGNGDEATTILFSYDTHGNLTETMDGEGNIKKFTFDQYDRLTSSLSAEGILQSIEYDANNNKTAQKVDLENGKVLKSTSAYDILDQVVENTIASNSDDQRVTKIVRDVNGNITQTTDTRGLVTKYTYDLLDQVTEKHIITDPNDQTKDIVTKYMYNKNGNIIQTTDPKGNKTTYTYDGFGRVISSTDMNNTVTKYGYDKTGNITATSITDANGTILVKGATTFNSLGKALTQTVIDPKTNTSKTTTYAYDQNGNLTSTTDPKGNMIQYVYNSHNQIKETIDPVGNKVQLTYDKRGLVVSKTIIGTNFASLTTSYVYDRDGRLIKETNNQQQSKAYTYNKQNKIIQTTDESGNKTDYTYDVFGNVLTETKYTNNKTLTTIYTYDSSNNLTSVTDANGNKTTYEYSLLNQRTKEILPDGSTTTYTYDANSNLASYTDPNGTRVTNTYDVLNRLTHRAIAPGTGVIGVTSEDYAYDTLGRLIGGNDSQNNAVAFQYDAFNNLTSEVNNGKTIGYTYDANANLTSLLFPSGKKLDRVYDQTNRLTGITLDNKNIASYGYNSLTLDSLTLANGAKTMYGYDALLRLKELTNIGKEEIRKGKNTTTQDIMINTYAFSYDSIGNITSNGQDTYGYDALSRLTNVTTSNPIFRQDDRHNAQISTLYNYDNLGNRDSVEQTTTWDTKEGKEKEKEKTRIADYVNNNLNQYTSVTQSKAKKIGFKYDKNGNLTDDGKQRYAYDYRNRLIKVTSKDGEIKAEFSYDVLGRRLAKTTYDDDDEVKKIIRYTYSNQDAIEENEYRYDDGKEKLKNVKEYIYGKGVDDVLVMILTTTNGKKKVESQYFYQKNQLGSITAITDDKGKVVEEYKYDAFGRTYIRDRKSDNWREFKESKIGNTRLFTGREYDKEIGLYYYRARYYSAELGRFISRDPIGMADDINLYSYVGNNPVKFVDPMGLEKALAVINMAYDLFARKQTEYSLMNQFGDLIDVLDSNIASSAYNAQITALFVTDTLLGESNIKMREDFGQYTTNRIQDKETIEQFGHAIGGEIYYQGNKIYLADIGNMIFGFNASNIGYSQSFMTTGQYMETLYKFGGNAQDTIKNEEDDKILINAGYALGGLSVGKTLSKDDFITTLLSAAIAAESIRLNQK